MKLSVKIVLIFSVMMLLGLLILSSYAAHTTIEGADTFTEMRFRNISTSVKQDLQLEYDTMDMTLRELTENTTFMAAVNQMVRDDSEDQKMAQAAARSAQSQLLQSPLVDLYYRVSFYTRSGIFLTASTNPLDRDMKLKTYTERARDVISSLPWLDEADEDFGPIVLSPHEDIFSEIIHTDIYGLAQQVRFHGRTIGYLEIANRYENLEHLIDYIDEDSVCIELIFDDGDRLYSNQIITWTWPDNLEDDTYSTVMADKNNGRLVYHTFLNSLKLHIYISQDKAITVRNNAILSRNMFTRAAYIMIPALLLIMFVSLGLTHSITSLTKKVRRIPADSVVSRNNEAVQALLSPVTSPNDQETHELEQVFDGLMLRLRDSAANEITLREGALQAQLSALQTQINPHFIYNTLNIISAKSMESGNFDVIEICDQFAQMLRYSTDTRSRTATMSDEIENVRNYLMLAKARYEDNLEFSIDVPEDLSSITLPKLTLQPLVENAITHGFDGTNVKRKLSVTGQIQDGQLILEIRDNGNGFSDEMLQSLRERIAAIEEGKVSIEASGGHIGLINTCLRLYYYSQGQMHVSIRNDQGAVITMTMPCAQKE